MRSNKSYVKETLAFVNKLRKQAGADPLDDLRLGTQSGHSCPISESLSDVVDRPYTTALDGDIYFGVIPGYGLYNRPRVKKTRAVKRFIRAFDTGRLPEYHI